MASDDKYQWRVGQPPPILDRHSQTKHNIIEEYVRRYILRLMSQATIPSFQLTLVDGFCGGGNYQTEQGGLVDGSPLLLMRAVREARALLNIGRRVPREINVNFEFVDISADTTSYLNYWINAKLQENAIEVVDHQRIKIATNSFSSELPSIVQSIKLRKRGEHAIFVLDQYAYKDIPLPEIAAILKNLKGAEVVMTINIDNMVTYLADSANNRRPLETIGLDAHIPWEQIKYLKATQKQEWRRVLQRYIAHGIKHESGAMFMTLFFVKPHGANTWGYWLIHLSNHYRAHEVMKSLHWEHATDFGHELEPGIFELGYNANKDIDYTGQATFQFGDQGAKELCIDGIREHFGKLVFAQNTPVRVGDLFEGCVTNSTAAEVHLLEATKQLHASKNIIVTSRGGVVRRPSKQYRHDDVIEASRQIILPY